MNDQERWDSKYAGAAGERRAEPCPFVVEWAASVGQTGRALDLASGTGRHALHLAQAGWQVSAWDVSPVGLAILEERARELDLELETRAIDVLAEPPASEQLGFDLVVCVLFLDRTLLDDLARYVAPGGHLIFATATEDLAGDKPPPRFRLRRGELEQGLAGFETVETHEADGYAGILARRKS